MPRQKYHRDRVYQEIGEPGPGAIGVGYVRFSMDLQSESSITTQKRLVKELFDKKGWKLAGWREEPERSANNYLDDLIEERPSSLKYSMMLRRNASRSWCARLAIDGRAAWKLAMPLLRVYGVRAFGGVRQTVCGISIKCSRMALM